MQESAGIRRNPARFRKTQIKGLGVAPTSDPSPPTYTQDRRDSRPTKRRRKPRQPPASVEHVSIAEKVRRLVNLNPQVRLGLAAGLMNHSALARDFLGELKLSSSSFHAVLSSVKRLAAELEKPAFERDARNVIGRSTISLRTGVAVVRLFPQSPLEKLRGQLRVLHSVQGTAATSLIVDARDLDSFLQKNREHVLEVRRDLTEITIVSPKEIVSTAGVLLSLLSPLYSNGINAEEVLSTHNDTILLVSTAAADRAFAVLNQVITDAKK